MAEGKSLEQTNPSAPPWGQRAKRAGLYLLFGAILFIPRIRRLRRKVWAWTLVRMAAAMSGVWLIWRYAHLRSGVASMGWGVLLLAFGLLARARPVETSVDEIATGLRSLIVLNGGAFAASPGAKAAAKCRLFIQSEGVIFCDPRHRRLASIPLTKFRSLDVRPSPNGKGKKHPPWEVEIVWDAEGHPRVSKSIYEGPFAEHLAQVAESTLRSQWKKELPILQ